MPVTYRFEPGILIFTLVGAHAVEELGQAALAAVSDAEFRPGTGVLFDVRESGMTPQTGEIIRYVELISRMSAYFSPNYAILVTRTVHFGLGRMAAVYAARHGLTFGVFYDPEEVRVRLLQDA